MSTVQDILSQLASGQPLDEPTAERVFSGLLSGEIEPAQIGALLAFIATRGPSVNELVGGARAMRSCVTRVEAPLDRGVLIDTCGTGGAPKTFNISTIGAFVTVASAPGKVIVAKHGSVSKTGRGSAEVMQSVGVNTAASAEVQARCLRELGICFSFATHHHPAMKHVAPTRKALGFPTIFNILGPLTNPAGARRQLIGTYSPPIAEKLALALHRLGVDRAIVLTSSDGLDELSPTAPAHLWNVSPNGVECGLVDPLALGVARCTIDDLRVHTLEDAAAVFHDVLSGVPGARADAVALNAAASLLVAGAVETMAGGLELAREGITSGRAARLLRDFARLSHQS